jgi:iron complex transport system ATP-binding protein
MQKDDIVIDSPQKLVDSGALSKIFPSDLIVFDKASASFKIKT